MAKEWWESYAPADEPKEDWWSQYSVEAEKPQGRRDVTPFKVDIQQPAPVAAKPAAARPVASAPSEDYTDAMGSDFGSAIMAAAEPKRASVLEGVTLPPQAPLIERRGAPVSEEKFKELKQKYEAATPKERAALMQAPGFESSVLQAIDTQYQAAPGFGDARRETRRSAYIAQGAAPELADQLAARDAAAGIETERLAAIKPSDFDFANRAEYKRPEGKLALEETGGLLGARMIQPTGFEQLVGAGKAIGGKVSGTFQSAAAGAWQFLGDTAEVAGDLVGSTQLADVGARLSSGNALQQKAAKAKLEAIGENPNAALNFIETGVAGAINNFAPYLVNPGLGMTAAVAQTFADEYGTGKAAGQTMSQALPRAGMMAAAEWIGEHASLPTPLMKGFKELVKGVPANEVMPQFARYLVKENAAEQVTTAMNFGTDKWAPFGLTPDATLKDYLSAVGDTFYQTTAQTLVMGGAGRVAAPIARKLQDLTTNPNSAFAEAFAGDVAGAQFDPAAIDAYARRALDVQAYDTSIIAPRQQAQVQQDQADLQLSTSAGDAATAADNLSGSLAELLVPRDAVTPLPIRIEPTLTEGKPLEMPGLPDELARIEPTMAQGLPLEAQGLPEVNPAIEQQFGLDKLRINAPRPQKIQGEPVANLTDDRLTSIVEDEGVHPMTRRGAAIELTARQAEQAPQAFAQQPAPQQTATPSTVAFAPASATPENLPSGVSFAPAAPAAPVAESRTYTPAELGSMTLGERRTLSRTFDQTENEDGTTTFTAKPGVAPAPSAAPAATTETNFGLGAAEGRVSDAPVAATGDAARAELQTRLNQAAAQHGVEVPTLAAPAKSDEATVTAIGKALGATGPVVAYADPNGADGFQLGGAIAINTKTQKGVAATAFHENHHIAEQIAAADTQAGRTDTPAQQYVASVNGLFDDMSDEGKRSYAVNFLHKDELASIADPVAREQRTQQLLSNQTLRSEMVADFMGNRATDRPFLADLAKADPKGFGGFVQKWIGILDNMLVRLRGVKDKSNLESVKVDQYIKDINRAKMVARDAMVAFRNGTLQQSATATTPLAFSQQQGELNAPSIGTAGSQILPGASASDRRGVDEYGGNPPPSYGTARQGAISVVGRHYSATPRQTLSGEYYGRGLKGAERTRLDSSPDPRLKNRVYFYVDQGKGIRPEAGVGGYAHETKLDNIYDPQTRLIKPQVDANAFESAVINAGFDGYIAPFGNGQSAVVLLGQKHKAVPVRAIGQPQAAALPAEAAPTTLKKGLMSKELSQIDTSNIPGARVRAGTLEIPAEQQDAANAELARIGSTVRFAKKEVAKPAEGETQQVDTAVYRSVADSLGLSEAEYNVSALPLMLGGTKENTFQTPNVGGIPEVVKWLDQRRAATGLAPLDINKPEDRKALAKLLAAEAVAAIRSAGNAVEWYDETVAKTLRTMAVKYPELNTDQNARNAFLMATAISSQTMNVEDNLRYASNQYEAFRQTGKFPETGSGKSAPAMANNFALANALLDELKPDLLRRFLQTEFTKRELEMMGYSIGGESMDEKMLGSAVFGPKIGFGFYSNLSGNFEPVTMDMWFMRTIGRLAGTLPAFDPVLFPKQVAKLRTALAETGPAERGLYANQFSKEAVDAAMRTNEGAIALAREVNSLHNRQFIKERAAFDSGARIKSALVGASGAILKSADKPTDSPSSGGERQRLREVVRQMVDLVEQETGKRVPPAALQALIWYPEQELYKKLGVRLRVTSQDYAGAAKSLLTKEGFDGKRISTAAQSGPGSARRVAGESVAGANPAAGATNGPSGPLQGSERETFFRERTAKVAADAVKEQSLESIFAGLDKRGLAKTRAEAAFTARPDGAQIKYVQENFYDILIKLEDADKVKINCD